MSVPSITGVSGTIEHGQSLTITGTGFGTKPIAAPLIYDDFESGSIDSGWANFYDGNKYEIVADENRAVHSTKSLRADFSDDTFHHFVCKESDAHDGKWYVHYWFKYASNLDWDDGGDSFHNIKFWRLFPTNWSNDHFVNVFINWRPEGGFAYTITEGAGTPDYYFKFNPKNLITLGVWHSIEVEYAPNSALDAEDGVIRFWFDGALKEEMTTAITSTTAHPNRDKYPYLAAGMHCAWGRATSTTYFWMDDIYVDRAWSRVVIGDSATWEQCAHKEIQVPSAWAETSVTVTIKQGSFADGTAAYLYVVNADGMTNPNGYPIQFSSNVVETPTTVDAAHFGGLLGVEPTPEITAGYHFCYVVVPQANGVPQFPTTPAGQHKPPEVVPRDGDSVLWEVAVPDDDWATWQTAHGNGDISLCAHRNSCFLDCFSALIVPVASYLPARNKTSRKIEWRMRP